MIPEKGVRATEALCFDSVFVWPCRGVAGSILDSGNARWLWEVLGKAYREVST